MECLGDMPVMKVQDIKPRIIVLVKPVYKSA